MDSQVRFKKEVKQIHKFKKRQGEKEEDICNFVLHKYEVYD